MSACLFVLLLVRMFVCMYGFMCVYMSVCSYVCLRCCTRVLKVRYTPRAVRCSGTFPHPRTPQRTVHIVERNVGNTFLLLQTCSPGSMQLQKYCIVYNV